jgi:GAF domain-containing protein
VESAVSVVGAGRGFVLLVAPDGGVHGEVAAGAAAGEDFRGSFGAIEKALASGEAVVAADARSDAFLGRRRSVAEMGIGALACVPLRADGRVEGVLYVDGPGRGPFTDLDVEILEALADHAALVLAGMEIHRRIRDLSESGSGSAAPAERAILRELAARFGSSPPSRSGGPRIGNA